MSARLGEAITLKERPSPSLRELEDMYHRSPEARRRRDEQKKRAKDLQISLAAGCVVLLLLAFIRAVVFFAGAIITVVVSFAVFVVDTVIGSS